MDESALLILFCDGFGEDDVRMHEDLIRARVPDIAIHSFVIRSPQDVDTAIARSHAFDQFGVWNCYWPVDGIAERIAEAFAGRLVGSRLAITRLTSRKSTTYRHLEQCGIACPWHVVITDAGALERITAIPFPVIVKADEGYDTVDMARSSLCADREQLSREAARLLQRHDAVIVQRFLSGREFTIAYANDRAFRPVRKDYPAERPFYLSGQPYEKRYDEDAALEAALRSLAERTAWAFGVGRTDYCRIDIREDSETGALFPIDVNDMCSVYPAGQFEASLAGDGVDRETLAHWLTAPLRLADLARRVTIYIPFFHNMSQVENLIPFLASFRCKVFLYPWADSSREMFDYFSNTLGAPTQWFSAQTFADEVMGEDGDVIVMLTEALSYDFGRCQKHFFEIARECFPHIIDVFSIGHCLEHSTCDACGSDVGGIPIKYTAHHNGLLPFAAGDLTRLYGIGPRTVLVSPTTGDDFILLARHDILRMMKEMQDEGRFEFLFKLHPSTEMMAFDDEWFQLERQGYAFVRDNFRRVSPQHFSVFPFTEAIKIHITDLYSSLPAMLTAFEGLTILAKDNPAVAADHPLRRHLHAFETAGELRAILLGRTPTQARPGPDFWRAHYPPVTGREVVSVALDRGWLERPTRPRSRETMDRQRFLDRVAATAADTRRRFQAGLADESEQENTIYFFEHALNGDGGGTC